jgi:hypothetical protein
VPDVGMVPIDRRPYFIRGPNHFSWAIEINDPFFKEPWRYHNSLTRWPGDVISGRVGTKVGGNCLLQVDLERPGGAYLR